MIKSSRLESVQFPIRTTNPCFHWAAILMGFGQNNLMLAARYGSKQRYQRWESIKNRCGTKLHHGTFACWVLAQSEWIIYFSVAFDKFVRRRKCHNRWLCALCTSHTLLSGFQGLDEVELSLKNKLMRIRKEGLVLLILFCSLGLLLWVLDGFGFLAFVAFGFFASVAFAWLFGFCGLVAICCNYCADLRGNIGRNQKARNNQDKCIDFSPQRCKYE